MSSFILSLYLGLAIFSPFLKFTNFAILIYLVSEWVIFFNALQRIAKSLKTKAARYFVISTCQRSSFSWQYFLGLPANRLVRSTT